MEKIIKALSSRTVWVICLMFVIGGVEAISGVIPGSVMVPLQGFLSFLAIYFKVNPSTNY